MIAAVNGAAIGIGTTLLLHCDFVYVADDSRLAMPFVGLGLVPEFASSLVLPRLMGHARAAEKLLLGDPFTGADAVDCGIANAVLPAAEVVAQARRVAERFNKLAPSAVRESKRLMRRHSSEEVMATMPKFSAKDCAHPKRWKPFRPFSKNVSRTFRSSTEAAPQQPGQAQPVRHRPATGPDPWARPGTRTIGDRCRPCAE